ncbi:MAG: hypothetical protein NTW73_03355, partial [Candidatus Parcubacteria bacterium]|nr:hypothetical protein [Candidatus Parcubacteria bacterium]
MKKLIVSTLFSLAFVFLFLSPVLADVVPGNSHPLNLCVKFVNLNEFPNIVLIGYYTGPMVDKYELYQVKNNECLTKGYKFNKLSIYWNTKDKLNSIDTNNLLLEDVEPYGGYVDQSNPLIKEDIEYSIAGFSGNKLVIYKSKQISEYNNGTAKKVETFDNPLGNITPTITIVKPAEGDNLVVGSKYTIQWQTQGDTSKLKEYVIYFYNILTKKYNPAVSVPINQTSYNWTVPSAIGNNHYLYVGGITNEGKKYWSTVRKFNIVGSTSTHKECNTNKQCVSVDGGGSDLCSTNNDCIVINPMLPFSCNSSTWQCYADPAGKYYSYSVCQDDCKATAKVYNFDLTPATSSKTALVNKYALHKFKIQNLGSTSDKYSINVNNIDNA